MTMSLTDSIQAWWEQISPSEKRTVTIAGIALPLTLIVWGGLKIHDGLKAREDQNNKMRKALEVLSDLRSRGPSAPPDTTLAGMPAEPAKLESYLEAAAKKVNVTIPRYSPGGPVTKNGFVTHSTRIDLNDLTIEQVKSFLQEVETGNRYVAVTQFNLSRDFKDKDKLDVRLEISAYATEPKAAAEGSGSGSAPAGKVQ
jgi:type II secretory pathway component PulM